ncbi:MAG: hypothetical protein GXN99_03110 [Candidatus Nanohaloarchaeota archaeon]|nr:hypothetical protein [Candidatus Nanohaloarchaeota archaeon]
MYKNRIIKITGVLPTNFNSEKIVHSLLEVGAKTVSIVSREIQVECELSKYSVIKEAMKSLRVEEIKIREAKLIENTVMQAGSSTDPSSSIKVTIVPATKTIGRKLLSITLAEGFELKEDEIPDFVSRSKKIIHKVLDKANVHHCLIAVELLKRPNDFEKALELAIVHTLLETNGLYTLNGFSF